MNPDRCSVGRCNKDSVLYLLGKPLCQKHWEEHCEKEEETKSQHEKNTWRTLTDC